MRRHTLSRVILHTIRNFLFAGMFLSICFALSCDPDVVDGGPVFPPCDFLFISGDYHVNDACSPAWGSDDYFLVLKGECTPFTFSNFGGFGNQDVVASITQDYSDSTYYHIIINNQDFQGLTLRGFGSISDTLISIDFTLKDSNQTISCTLSGSKK